MEQYTGVYDQWGLQEEIRLLKVAQFEHAERLSQHSERIGKLEKRHDDSRIRSLWSTPSPFPAPLSTFSQHPSASEPGAFRGFDQQQNLALSGLQLDEVDVPRRGASRANSVRFDDSATTNHWIHDSPGTSDYFGQRSSNSIGGYAMTERSSSHKSDTRSEGRHSLRSFGDSILPYDENTVFGPPIQGSDIPDSCLNRTAFPRVTPAPAMIRCWLNTAPAYDPLLYAVVCTGAARSSIELPLLVQLGLQDRIIKMSETESKIELSVFLPDAIVQQYSRNTGPSKSPRLTIEFLVVPVRPPKSKDGEKVRIFIGSDVIASHMGDVLFSQNKIFLHTDDGRRVFVPFIRPDADDSFADVFTGHAGHYILGDATAPINGNGIKQNGGGVSVAGKGDSARSYVTVSSPRPIHGTQASVIRGVATMEPHDFTTKESEHTTTTTEHDNNSYQTDEITRPWTAAGDTRKVSYVSAESTDFSPGQDDHHLQLDGKVEVERMSRGRSLTNPFEDAPVIISKAQSSSIWDGTRKSAMSYSAPLKDGNGGNSGSGSGSYSRGSSRGMKVLRTSKSFSSSQGGLEPTAPAAPTKHATFVSMKSRGHGRTMSGGDAINSGSSQKGSLVRTKSSNVVGGATAFHWMAPKTTAGSD